MTTRTVVVSLFLVAVFFAPKTSPAQNPLACDSPTAISGVRDELIKRGTKDVDWLVRLGLNVPAFRMKDVAFVMEQVRTLGPWRAGVDCEARIRMTTPLDVLDPNIVIATFRYVVVSGSGGEIGIELY